MFQGILKRIKMSLRPYRIQSRRRKLRRKGNRIGESTFVSRYAFLDESGFNETNGNVQIKIGKNCYITRGCKIMTHSRAKMGGPKGIWSGKVEYGSVNIGNNVFIGWDSIILPGVTIGDNVIIGAMSLVNKDIPSNVMAAGVPAKVIKDIEEVVEID